MDDAIARARRWPPANAQRFGIKTPCNGLTGQCGNCTSPDCICCQMVITALWPGRRIKVILVGDLGPGAED